MIKPRDGEMNYEKLEDLAGYYMFIAACLTEKEVENLKKAWNEQGGYEKIEWWRFVMENTKVELDLKEEK